MRPIAAIMVDPDHAIIDQVLKGNERAYAVLVEKHKSYAFTLAYKVLQNRPEAEDAAQEAFIKAFHHLHTFNREAKFSTWLYRIIVNTAISLKRKSKHRFVNLADVRIETRHEGEGVMDKQDKQRYLHQAMNKLSEADRTALTLFYLKEFSLEEIASITGLTADTLKVRLHRARIRLADELTLLLKKEALSL